MKKAIFLLLVASSSLSFANPAADFSNIVQNFAHERNLRYIPSSDDASQLNRWAYSFVPLEQCKGVACGGLLISFSYGQQDRCIDNVGLFGDLPLSINGYPALFTMPQISDSTSQLRDFLNVYKNNICYSITYGVGGNGLGEAVRLAKELVGD